MAMVMENQQPLARMPLLPAPPLPPPPPPPPLPQAYKHRCKVCKKGFMCGRALGGHMRSHGVTEDALLDDSVPCGAGGSSGSPAAAATSTAKRMYALRTNPGRLKSCRVCEHCGKEFTSWKSLLDHGRCNGDDLDGGNNGDAGNDDGEEGDDLALASGWSKGKRTRRAKVNEEQVPVVPSSSEEEDLANFLVKLSSSSSSSAARPQVIVEADQASKDEQSDQLVVPQAPIFILAPTVAQMKLLAPPQVLPHHAVSDVPRGMFQCKACKKVFTSHQALGGHRASHKKVKGCFAAKLDSNRSDPPHPIVASDSYKVVLDTTTAPAISVAIDGNTEAGNPVNAGAAAAALEMAVVDETPAPSTAAAPFKKKGKVHECSVCHRVFTSGQALGGHKRCHWLTTGASDPTAKLQPFVTAQDHAMHAMCQQLTLRHQRMFDASSDPFQLELNVATANPSSTAMRQAAAELNDSVPSLNVPASLYMHSWAGQSNGSNMNNTVTSGNNDDAAEATEDDEADSTSAKRAKISDLKDMNMGGETSPWLQVGIGLTSEIDEEKTAAPV
ncbi:hypothetical protein HU200_007271 [Digitaria exilis]|uniref:C2H2-type domain-containing protein n=1 Tax=Digitaria exilis TaxID=1010633 RepID=A0A835FQF9_9POAL|nr:hypothetical protein HU200_007271 [Digitaria exilis]